MSQDTIGWVMDTDTSTRRLHLAVVHPGELRVTVEVYGQPSCVVDLDEDGVVILRGLLGQALERLAPDEGA
jgi:hypothetical protein